MTRGSAPRTMRPLGKDLHMLGGLGNLAGLIKQARQMKEQMERIQEELEHRSYQADAGAGLVVATVNGKGDLTNIRIDPKALEDVEMLEDLIKAAVGAASAKAREAIKGEMERMAGGLNVPGLTELLGQ